LRTRKAILRKASEWKNNPMLVSGLYRLFTYLPWEAIPKKYKEFFPKESEKVWDEDLKEFNKDEILRDIDAEIRAILKVLVKKNITHSIGLIPMILADMYMYDIGIAPFQGKLLKITNTYKINTDIDRNLAEQLATIQIINLLKEFIKKLNLNLSFDIDRVREEIAEQMAKAEETNKEVALALAKSKKEKEEVKNSDTKE